MLKYNHVSSNHILLFFLLISVMSLSSCTDFIEFGNNFLAKPPSRTVNQDSIFSHAETAKRFLWHAYRSLPYGPGAVTATSYDRDQLRFAMLASLTDINQSYMPASGANKDYYSGAYSAHIAQVRAHETIYNYFNSGAWAGIREAYIFINNVDQVPDMSEETKKRLKAEARMIIAFHYIEFFRNYGGMPWVDHAYKPNETFKAPRMTAMATLDSIIAVIDRAIPHLPLHLIIPEPKRDGLLRQQLWA